MKTKGKKRRQSRETDLLKGKEKQKNEIEAKSGGMKKKAFLVEVGVGHGTYQDRRGAGGGGQRCWSCP